MRLLPMRMAQQSKNTSGAYLEFTLHFMAAKDMVVHLTSANSSSGAEDLGAEKKHKKNS